MDKDKISLYSIIITIVAIFLLMHIADLNKDLENERLANAYLQASVTSYYSVLSGNNDVGVTIDITNVIDNYAQDIVNEKEHQIIESETERYELFLNNVSNLFNDKALADQKINSISKNIYYFSDYELGLYSTIFYDTYGAEMCLDDVIGLVRKYNELF